MIEQQQDLDIKEYKYEIPDPLLIFEEFANSELGEELRGRTRFHVFQPESVSNRRWTDAAGPDTNNLLHMMETYRLTAAFLASSEGLSKKEKELLLFTAIVHDMGEVVDGDIPDPDKTEDQEEEEMRMFSGILEYHLRDHMGEFERYNLIGDVVDIMMDKESKLGRVFNSIEKLGYNTTALNCWRGYRMLKENEEELELRDGFRTLAHEVIVGDMPKLVNFSKEYQYVKLYLIQNRDYISDVLSDAGALAKCEREKYDKASSSWVDFNASHPA